MSHFYVRHLGVCEMGNRLTICTMLLISSALSACCKAQNCPPPRVTKVEVACELPPPLELPEIQTSDCPSWIEEWACFPPAEAGKLALRLAEMRDWIEEARKRCEWPTTQPINPSRWKVD